MRGRRDKGLLWDAYERAHLKRGKMNVVAAKLSIIFQEMVKDYLY